MKIVRWCGTALAAAALSVGVMATVSGPAHADTSWGFARVQPHLHAATR